MGGISYQKEILVSLQIVIVELLVILGDEKGVMAFLREVDNKQEVLCYGLNP